MPALPEQVDVAILGTHPSATFASLLLAEAKISALQVAVPGATVSNRSMLISPQMFALHPLAAELEKKLKLWPGHGLRFLGEEKGESIATQSAKPATYIADFAQVAAAFDKLRKRQKIACVSPVNLAVAGVDEGGVVLSIDNRRLAVRALLVAEVPGAEVTRQLNIHPPGDQERPRDVTLLRLPASVKPKLGSPATLPINLNLAGSGAWAWLLPGEAGPELSVLHPADQSADPRLITRWLAMLEQHDVLTLGPADRKAIKPTTFQLPAAGALHGETVANRTLLIGPAGGFITACSEELYPSLWSAKLAVEHLAGSLGKSFLQDDLASFPQAWGATLGDYLRGPQQNLKFLLPLVYRNGVMAQRLADAILTGESVVR